MRVEVGEMGSDTDLIVAALPAYDVGEPLGSGAWGVVIAGHHRSLEREVAIKQLPRSFGADPAVRARFMTEARLLARLDHPHIVPIYDFVEHDDLCLLIMERLTGGTVWSRFRNEGFTQRSACAVVLATCAALQYAHDHGVLHRDVKPENLMFSAEGVLKVTDFGIAKVVGGSATMATKAGTVLGTPAYMAPEQATGGELSAATDVYAMGTVLYELLAGQLPYPAPTDPIAALYQRVHESHRPLTEVAASVPTPIAEVVGRALQRDPEDRYASAVDFGVALATAAITAWGSQWSTRSGITLRGADAIVARADAAMGSAPRTTPVDALDLPPLVAPGAEHQPAAAVGELSPSQLVPLDDAALTAHPSDAETIAPQQPIAPSPPILPPRAPAASKTRPRRRRMLATPAIAMARYRAMWITLGAVILLGVVVLVVSRDEGPRGPAGTKSFKGLSTTHVEGDVRVRYPQTPPVGGDHSSVWQDCGFYGAPIRPERGVHSMEHGAVWITYRWDLGAGEVDQLRALVEGQGYVLVSSWESDLPSPVVASAWGRQLRVASASDPRLREFVRVFERGRQAPEPGGPCSGGVASPQ